MFPHVATESLLDCFEFRVKRDLVAPYPICVHLRTCFSMCDSDGPQPDTERDDIVELQYLVISRIA